MQMFYYKIVDNYYQGSTEEIPSLSSKLVSEEEYRSWYSEHFPEEVIDFNAAIPFGQEAAYIEEQNTLGEEE